MQESDMERLKKEAYIEGRRCGKTKPALWVALEIAHGGPLTFEQIREMQKEWKGIEGGNDERI